MRIKNEYDAHKALAFTAMSVRGYVPVYTPPVKRSLWQRVKIWLSQP